MSREERTVCVERSPQEIKDEKPHLSACHFAVEAALAETTVAAMDARGV